MMKFTWLDPATTTFMHRLLVEGVVVGDPLVWVLSTLIVVVDVLLKWVLHLAEIHVAGLFFFSLLVLCILLIQASLLIVMQHHKLISKTFY